MLQKLEKTLFFIFLILIPFQIRIFVGPAINEWNSFFVYFADIVLFLVFLLFLNRLKKTKFRFSKKNWLLILFILIAFISIFISSATDISIFRWLKLVEFVALYVYVALNFKFRTCLPVGGVSNFESKNEFLNKTLLIIIYSGVFQAVLAVVQFIKQGSIGIKFIEAGFFRPDLPGVANFSLNGELIMRSYGSFSHPNVLAGFLLLTIFCLYRKLLTRISNFEFQISKLALSILIFALFLTFSRVAIMVFLIGSLAMFLFEFFRLRKLEHTEQRLRDGKNLIKIFVLVIVSCLLVIVILFPHIKARFFTISLQEQAIDLRFFYNRAAVSMIKENPVLGIGIGNFVNYSHNYPIFLRAASKVAGENVNQIPGWVFQPVHNIYLLIASEAGALGLLVFLLFIISNIRKLSLRREIQPLTILFFGFLIIALSDHYFWTLQSGAIIFWLALALTKTETEIKTWTS